ncbi:MAG: hypothetical protein DBX46_01050 [Clostridiales bacterium]|nr:MAG: hypothetical protein DBX46_01050 [Clostridiales bacterium]
MSTINVSSLTFAYEGSWDNIFENASFSCDTSWRLGLVGRNGRGKTTLPQRRNGHLPVSLRQTFGRVINSLLRYTFRNG